MKFDKEKNRPDVTISQLKGDDRLHVEQIKSSRQFERAKNSGLVLVAFVAPWCVPSRDLEPILRRLAMRFDGKALITVANIDENTELARTLDVRCLPTLIIFRNSEEIQRFAGLHPESTLVHALKKLLE